MHRISSCFPDLLLLFENLLPQNNFDVELKFFLCWISVLENVILRNSMKEGKSSHFENEFHRCKYVISIFANVQNFRIPHIIMHYHSSSIEYQYIFLHPRNKFSDSNWLLRTYFYVSSQNKLRANSNCKSITVSFCSGSGLVCK